MALLGCNCNNRVFSFYVCIVCKHGGGVDAETMGWVHKVVILGGMNIN